MVWTKTISTLFLAQVFSVSLLVLGSTLEDQCNALTKPHFYDQDTNICHVLDGPKRFVDARESCTDLPFGYLMVEHSEADMTKIALFSTVEIIQSWNIDLSDEIKVGQMITIKGKVLPAIQNYRFSINLMDANRFYLMHIDTQFNFGGFTGHLFWHRLSTIPWTKTGHANQTMVIDQDFLVQINTTAAAYEVFVNGEFIQTFPHKLPFSNVKDIFILGYSPAQPNTYVIDFVTIDINYGGQACTWINLQPTNRSSFYPDQGWQFTKDVGQTVWNANVNLTNWDRDNSEPNNLEGKENCSCLIASTGKLMDVDCDGLAPFICSYENKPSRKCFHLYSENKKSPPYGVLKNEQEVDSNICMKKCSRISSCASIIYNKDTKYCQLQYCKSHHPGIEPEDAQGYEQCGTFLKFSTG